VVFIDHQSPHPWRAHGRRMYFEDTAHDDAVRNNVIIVIAPHGGWATNWGALEYQIVFFDLPTRLSALIRLAQIEEPRLRCG
jgi:hypothetical protein